MLNLARRVAKKSDYYQRVGCVILKKKRIIGIGYNQPKKTHPKATNEYQKIHAELSACLGLSFDELRGATAYVARIFSNGDDAIAMPCPHCMAMLKSLSVKKAVFTRSGQSPETLYL